MAAVPGAVGPAAPDPDPDSNFNMHGLIGLSPGRFSETVRNSISSLTRRDCDAAATSAASCQPSAANKALMRHGDNDASVTGTGSSTPWPPAPPEPRPRHLLALPPEIMLMVLQRLDFASIARLRLTCKTLRALASPHQIRILVGPAQLRMQLLGHCKTCLVHDPFRARLLQPPLADPGYPLASQCLDCALAARDPRIAAGKKLVLANFDTVWVCRWCGYPIVDGAAFGFEQMHHRCYRRYNDVLLAFFVLGWLQLGLGVVAAALAWTYYRGAALVFGPTVMNFILLWICLLFLIWRGRGLTTYRWTLAIELTILALWIPPVYHIATDMANTPGASVARSAQATLAMFVLNMLFRLLNLCGNVLLMFRHDITRRRQSSIPKWRLPLHRLATALVMWTYPQSVEQKYPPDFS
ncbi:hypothetical protein N658DRAFT_501409 [Parathielavia hyrcaniae]|uniref:F-box domain-containing protein n=1 Tax=Parathielavia hyrcaniae TaxID=113614 RepID=A0AAN6PRF5_9PEZI|nr:hypothetical protein N658DRAFT_501409 [Parathielavia hyrcaniae]